MAMSGDYVSERSRRLNADKAHRKMRAQEAVSAAQRCARLLYENYGVTKVYQFGSLRDPAVFREKSDIDLVVEGLPPRLYFKALAELWRQLPPGIELDLIPFEDADPELRERVLKEGMSLSLSFENKASGAVQD